MGVPKELQKTIPNAKSHTSCHFVPTTATASGGQNTYDAVTAGSNGYLYLWSNGLCSTATRVDKATFTLLVTTSSAIPYAVVCTARGTLKVSDARTLLPLTKCKLTSSLPQSVMSTLSGAASSYA